MVFKERNRMTCKFRIGETFSQVVIYGIVMIFNILSKYRSKSRIAKLSLWKEPFNPNIQRRAILMILNM